MGTSPRPKRHICVLLGVGPIERLAATAVKGFHGILTEPERRAYTAGTVPSVLEKFTAATFGGLRDETFRIRFDESRWFEAELVDVSEHRDPGDGRRTPFSLVFRAPMDVLFPQRIYPVDHAELGTFELFLVPIGPDESGMRYEAVFT